VDLPAAAAFIKYPKQADEEGRPNEPEIKELRPSKCVRLYSLTWTVEDADAQGVFKGPDLVLWQQCPHPA
jgi:hypothetical protein